MKEVAQGLANGLDTLAIGAPLARPFVDAITKKCSVLRCLSVEHQPGKLSIDYFCDIIAACGSTLDSLTVLRMHANERVVLSIADHCSSLRHLKLSYPDMPHQASLAPMWKALGNNLLHLEVFGERYLPAFGLRGMTANCRKVSRLTLDFGGPWDKWIQIICCSFGANLLELKLRMAAPSGSRESPRRQEASLARIRNACPNIRIEVPKCNGVNLNGSSTDFAIVLGPSLVSWALHFDASVSENVFTRVGTSCPNVERCFLNLGGGRRLSKTAFSGLLSRNRSYDTWKSKEVTCRVFALCSLFWLTKLCRWRCFRTTGNVLRWICCSAS